MDKDSAKVLLDAFLKAPDYTYVTISLKPIRGEFTVGKKYRVFEWDLVNSHHLDLLLKDDNGKDVWVYTAYTTVPVTQRKKDKTVSD